jgi:hypothetical protein
MKYIKLLNGIPENYTLEQLLIDFPNAIIYKKTKLPNEELIKEFNVYPLVTTQSPELQDDETAEEGIPVLKDNEWTQTWNIRKLTQEEVSDIIQSSLIYVEEIETDTELSAFFVDTEVREARYDICKACTSFTALKTCNECHCIMPLKTKLRDAVCPLGKW